MRPNNSLILNAVSAATNQVSTTLWSDCLVRASFQVVLSGTSQGSVQLQGSNDQAVGQNANQFTPTHWSDIGSSVVMASAGVYLIPATEMSYEYLQLVYTCSSAGTGTVTARMKSINL